MKLVIAIVHERDKHRLADRLIDAGFTFTKLGSTGGFLRQGNATLLIGVEEDNVSAVLDLVNECAGSCERFVNVPPEAAAPFAVGAVPPSQSKPKPAAPLPLW